MARAKHAGGIRKGFDDSLDDLVLVTRSLKPDIELVAAHEADPQHHFSHARTSDPVAPADRVADCHSATTGSAT